MEGWPFLTSPIPTWSPVNIEYKKSFGFEFISHAELSVLAVLYANASIRSY